MNRIQCLILFLGSAATLMASDQIGTLENLDVKPAGYSGPSAHVLIPYKPDVILTSDPQWTCKVWYLFKDTRSEGMHVQILHRGKLLHGDQEGQAKKVTTPYGEFEWKGRWSGRKNLFDLSGWVPVKVETLYPEKGRTLGK